MAGGDLHGLCGIAALLLVAVLGEAVTGYAHYYLTMLVAQRSRELALLRAVGASRKQVTRAVIGEAIGVGVVGSTLGIAAGVGLEAVFGTKKKSSAKGALLWLPSA